MNQLISKILQHEGAASIVTNSDAVPHLTATWNSYIELDKIGKLLIPAGGYHQTESNINSGSKLIMLIASKEVAGKQGMGTGLRLTGSAVFVTEGNVFNKTKNRFNWARAVLVFTVEKIEQLI